MKTPVIPAAKLGIFAVSIFLALSCAPKRQLTLTHTNEPGEIVIAEGSAPIIDKNIFEAKAAALADAQRSAVEMSVGVYITAKTRVEKALAVESGIMARTQGYITRYDILEQKADGEFYRVKIKALVRLEDISKDLKRSGIEDDSAADKRKVTVVIAESIDGAARKEQSAGGAIIKELLSKNFTVASYEPQSEKEPEGVLKGEENLIKSIFKKTGSDVIITGSARSFFYTDQNLGGFISYRADIALKALKADTLEVLLSVSNASSGVDVARQTAALKALANAGTVAGREAAEKLASALKKYSSVRLEAANVKNLNTANEFINHIRQAGFVRSVVLEDFRDAALLLDVRLNSEDSKALSAFAEKFKGGKVSVTGVSKYSITAEVAD